MKTDTHILIEWSIKNGGITMWQKKEKSNLENISIEEYLVRRKNIREEDDPNRQGVILPENRKLFFAGLYM